MRKVLIALNCHPEREPKIFVPPGYGYDIIINKTSGYGNAIREAIHLAVAKEMDLVVADTDGYHPVEEIVRLAQASYEAYTPRVVIKPYRTNIGIQSWLFTWFYSAINFKRFKDATGGMYRLSYHLMFSMNGHSLKTNDMTINLEILKAAMNMKARFFQYGYKAAENDRVNSKRTKNYQFKLLKEALKERFSWLA